MLALPIVHCAVKCKHYLTVNTFCGTGNNNVTKMTKLNKQTFCFKLNFEKNSLNKQYNLIEQNFIKVNNCQFSVSPYN